MNKMLSFGMQPPTKVSLEQSESEQERVLNCLLTINRFS